MLNAAFWEYATSLLKVQDFYYSPLQRVSHSSIIWLGEIVKKERSKGQTVVSISLSEDLLGKIDGRAEALGLPRSQYLALVARKDVMLGGSLVIPTAHAPKRVNINDAAIEFLKVAIAPMIDYEHSGDDSAFPEPPPPMVNSDLWACLLNECDGILEYKWLESEKLGSDIGMDRAIREWLQKHHALWATAQTV
jgi:hypothetical protein